MISPRVLLVLTSIAVLLPGTWAWPASSSAFASGAAHVADPSHPVPQHHYDRGQRGYNIIPARSAHFAPSTGPRKPVFRGGVRTATQAPATTTSSTAAPMKTSTPLVAAGPQLYSGLNKAGMPASLSGGATPPDSTGAIGPNNYVEMDNDNVTVYDRSLNQLSSTSFDNFLTAPGAPFCDPQIQWDNAAGRWLMSFLYCSLTDKLNQGVFVGWSATADPSNLTLCQSLTGCPGWTGWCGFVFGNGSDLLDFQKLGHSTRYVVVGGNLYDVSVSSTNPPFVSAALEWAPMPANGDQSCTLPTSAGTSGTPLLDGDGVTHAFTPVPVNETSTSSDVWIVSAYDAGGNVTGGVPQAQSALSNWDLTSTGTLVAHQDVNVNGYSNPTPAQQLGSTNVIDTSDTRLSQAIGDPTAGMWTQHTVSDGSGRSEVDWYELAVSGPNLTLIQQGNIDTANAWTFNAAISPPWDGNGAAIFYTVSSSTQDPTVIAQTRHNFTAKGSFDPGQTVLAASLAADTDFSCNLGGPGIPCRWGDYSDATPDPVHQTIVWGTSETNTATGATPAWLDQNFAVHVPNVPGGVANLAAGIDGRGDAALTWLSPQFEPDACPAFVVQAFVSGVFSTSRTITGFASAMEFAGLTTGTAYTFTVTPYNCNLNGPTSAPSNSVTIAGIDQTSPASGLPRPDVTPVPTATPQPR